ncbi:hypothetical protein SB758_33630, partial [Burkholderia sp. SIMBA_013]
RSLGARIQDPGAFSAPAAVPEPVAQAAAHFWESALAAARAEQAEANRQRWAELHEEATRCARARAGARARPPHEHPPRRPLTALPRCAGSSRPGATVT